MIAITVLAIVMNICSYAQFENDASHQDMEFWKFKSQLEAYVVAKDRKGLQQLFADTVFETGAMTGQQGTPKEAFLQQYFQQENSAVWKTLLTILRFGFSQMPNQNIGAEQGTLFKGPSYLNHMDSNQELIVLGTDVNVRSHPGLGGKIVEKASFKKYTCDCDTAMGSLNPTQNVDGVNWIRIYLEDGTPAYIASRYTSYALSEALTIAKVQGTWKIIAFGKTEEVGC